MLPARVGKYELEERIGAGGMAEVYRARVKGPEGFEKIVALKRVLPIFSEDPDFVRMFVHEARVAARLQHANIVQIYDFDQEGGRHYLAMEYVAGKDLRAVIRAAGKPTSGAGLPLALAAFVAGEVLKALHYAQHTAGLVHRDISPHNVLLAFGGDVKLGDFGIAKAQAAASATRTGAIKGKLAYMSPEQVDGSDVDGRSDLFATGVVLYEMLSGQRPFAGASDAELVAQVMAARPRPIREANAAVPEDLAAVVGRLLQRDPEARYQTALDALTAMTDCGCYRADPVGMGVWLQGLFPQDAREEATRATRSESGRTKRSDGLAPPVADTRTSSAEAPTVRSPRRRRPWIGILPLLAGLIALGVAAWRSPERERRPAVAAAAPDEMARDASPQPATTTKSPTSAMPATREVPADAGSPTAAPATDDSPSWKRPARTRSRPLRKKPTGHLKVGIHPWVEIKVNGRGYGHSPKTIRLPVGRYRVDLAGPGGKRRERVVIRAGQTTEIR